MLPSQVMLANLTYTSIAPPARVKTREMIEQVDAILQSGSSLKSTEAHQFKRFGGVAQTMLATTRSRAADNPHRRTKLLIKHLRYDQRRTMNTDNINIDQEREVEKRLRKDRK